MRSSFAAFFLSGLLAIILCGSPRAAFCVVTLDVPDGGNTKVEGIDGNIVVGNYIQNGEHGFLYNLSTSTFTLLPDPALADDGSEPYDISGNKVVGTYHDSNGSRHGFVYDLSTSTYTTLDDPFAATNYTRGTSGIGISGNNIVGNYSDSSYAYHGFLYDGSTYLTLDDPNADQNRPYRGTGPQAISGNIVVGLYYDTTDKGHGFLYNISTKEYTTLDHPLTTQYTVLTGIDGNTVLGEYFDASNYSHLFLYDIPTATYTDLNLDLPGPFRSSGGISGNTIVGSYDDTLTHTRHGFVVTIPEPSTIALLGMSAFGLLAWTWRRRHKAI